MRLEASDGYFMRYLTNLETLVKQAFENEG